MEKILAADASVPKATGAMPSPSGVALALLDLARKEDVTTQEIANVIQTDPTLAGRLLVLANAPTVGMSRPVASVHDAVVILGFSVVRALAKSLITRVFGPARWQRHWRHRLWQPGAGLSHRVRYSVMGY